MNFTTVILPLLLASFLGVCAAAKDGAETESEEFVFIRGGKLQFERLEHYDIKPVGVVNSSVKEFYLQKTEVTVREFAQFVRDTGYKTDAEKGVVKANALKFESGKLIPTSTTSWREPLFDQEDTHPITCVTPNDANNYCEWLSKKSDCKYRLPTNIEWIYACTLNSETMFDFDQGQAAAHVNVIDQSLRKLDNRYEDSGFDDGFPFTAPAGAKLPGRSGLIFMHGNVLEICLCADPEEKNYFRYDYVICGGAWMSELRQCAANFQMPAIMYCSSDTGFRMVRVPKQVDKN